MKFLKENDLAYPWLMLVIWIVLSIFINPVLNAPMTDDWMYAYPVKSLLETGNYSVNGVFAPTLLFQAIWGYLFCLIGGFSFTTLRISTLVLAFIGILFFYQITKRYSNSGFFAFLLCLLAMCNPFFVSLSQSFMTDVPFLAVCIISIYFYQSFFITEKLKFLILGTLFSIIAFLIRQPAIIFPLMIAIIVVLFKRPAGNYWKISLVLIITSILVYFSTELIKSYLGIKEMYVNVTGQYFQKFTASPFFVLGEITKKSIKAIINIGLYTLPILPLIKDLFRLKKHWHILVFISNMVLLIILIRMGRIFPFEGTTIINFGIGPVLLKDMHLLGLKHAPYLPDFVLIIINFIGQIAGTYLFIALFRYVKKNFTPFHVLLVAFSFVYIALMAITSFFDRYLLLPIFIAIILASALVDIEYFKGFRRIIAIAIFIPFVWFSIVGTRDYMAGRRAHLKAFEWALSQGISTKKMNAGMELNDWYNYDENNKKTPEKGWWWVNDEKYILTMGDIEGYHRIARFPFNRNLNFSKGWIYVLKRNPDSVNYKKKNIH